MARLRLTLHNVDCYTDANGTSAKDCLQISTEKETDSAYFTKSEGVYVNYTLNLVDFSFKKKMYQPTEIIAAIQLTMATGATWTSLNRSTLDSLFKFKKVSLEELSPNLTENTVEQTIGDDFYVHEVLVNLMPDAMYVTLKIYSLDKLMTLQQTSRTFVAKKLGDGILKTELTKYIKPWTIDEQIPVVKKQITDKMIRIAKLKADNVLHPNNSQISTEIKTLTEDVKKLEKDVKDREATQKPVTYSIDNMQTLKYGDNKVEHIFPYLVQYNESFYDMLARTTNRWGEFMYYENNQLNIGYAYDEKNVTEIKANYGTIAYVDLEAKKAVIAEDGNLDYAGADEKGFLDSTLRKSPNTISGTLFWPTTKKWDKVLMKEITSFLKNDKNVPTWLGNRLFDNTWDLAVKAAEMKKGNDEFDDKWFPEKDGDKPCKAEHYGDYNFGSEEEPDNDSGVNLFSEVNSKYKSSKYAGILAKEQSSGRNAVCIDFLTNCPKLKLGDVIKVSGELFIVVEISSKTVVKDSYGIAEDDMKKAVEDKKGATVTKTSTTALTFHVVATAQDSSDSKFYPAVIPAGHIRQSGPQVATIADADDPSGKNRVRVLFPWQDTKDTSSPWLTFTTGGAGSPVIGKHYKDDKVLIGFVDGNVERPYVLGGLTGKGSPSDYIQTTPGGHQLTLQDDEDGIKNFLTGMFLPCVDTFGPFLTAIPAIKSITDAMCKPAQGAKNNLAMGGGFELSDNYGIYKISGSTDGREVAIASPWGDVNINAFTGITISAPNGDVSIRGKNVTIEAGNNLNLISGTNVKNKILGGSASGFGADVATAVAKKLADKLTNIIDLSVIRAAIEIVFRPAEGALRIKSNRFLMLEAGKGQCVYPTNAYKDADTYNEAMSELKKNDFRPGMKLSSGVVEMFSKVITLGNMYDSRFMKAYNKCVDLQKVYSDLLKKPEICKWHNEYTDANRTPVICKKYEDLITNFWADGNGAISETDLDFNENYKSEDAQVKDSVKKRYADDFCAGNRTTETDNLAVPYVKDVRAKYRNDIKTAADNLRNAIIAFKSLPQLTEKEIKKTFRFFRDRNLPKDFESALVDAFKKDKLVDGDDVFYFKAPSDDQKKLDTPYTADILKPHRIVLERKAAILTLEGMGFKDEWREKKPNPDYGVAGKATKDQKYLNEVKVERKFKAADLSDDTYWNSYVDSLVTLPKLSSLEWKAVTEFKKKAMANFESLKFWESVTENKSWGDAKNGAILFSFDSNIYNLKKTTEDVPAPWKEQLTVDDDLNNDVKGFLDGIKEKMKTIQ